MHNIARVAQATGRAALPVVGASVATAVAAPVSHADAVAHAHDVPLRRIADEWELADFHDKDRVLFTPADIDNAVAFFSNRRPEQSAVIEELDSDSSSDGTVDAVIERGAYSMIDGASSSNPAGSSTGIVSLGLDQDLFAVAAKLLKSPGVQREICSAALSDPEVFEILASKMDLPSYLEGQGIAVRGLLSGPQAGLTAASDAESYAQGYSDAASAAAEAAGAADADSNSSNPIDRFTSWTADKVEGVGFAVVKLARWMRGKLGGEQAANSSSSTGGQAEGKQGADSKFMRFVGGGALAVMVACVAIISVALLRKPRVLVGLMRQMRAR